MHNAGIKQNSHSKLTQDEEHTGDIMFTDYINSIFHIYSILPSFCNRYFLLIQEAKNPSLLDNVELFFNSLEPIIKLTNPTQLLL